MSSAIDDALEYCIKFILDRFQIHSNEHAKGIPHPPFFLGVSGIQGSGKTTLTSALAQKLGHPPYCLTVVVLSVDDLYLSRKAQSELAASHPANPLVQHRGQPSTHDLPLAVELFSKLRRGATTSIPSYDKSAFDGLGDRFPEERWITVNQKASSDVDLVILEGWCVGYRALSPEQLQLKWQDAVNQRGQSTYHGRLGCNSLENVHFINEALRDYDSLTDQLDALIHMDAEDTQIVYRWRQESEERLRESHGSGMTDEQVSYFVDGYYPAYELFTDDLRTGTFDGERAKQLRLIIGNDRKVRQVIRI